MGRIRVRDRIVFWATLLLVATGTLCAQGALPTPDAGKPAVDPVVQRNIDDWAILRRGLPDDWTHHYLVFSNPGTAQQAIESGKFEEWLKIVDDPRFTLQQIKRSAGAKALEGTGISAASTPNEAVLGAGAPDQEAGTIWRVPPKRRRVALKKDWAVAFGGVAASGTGTVTTNNASGTSTVMVDGQTLTASAPTTASATGTFSGAPGAGQGITITNGANVLNLTTNATASFVVGTVSGAPTSNSAPTITFINSAPSSPNILSLTTNATGATATGTFSSTGPTNGQTLTIQNGLNSNTLTLTFLTGAATPGTGTVTVTNANGAANGDTVTIGSVTYTFEETTTPFPGQPFTGAQYYCPTAPTGPCVWWGTTAANQAQALYAAITNNPAACPALYGTWESTCYSYITAPNPNVTATLANPGTGAVISLVNTSGSNAPFLTASSQSAFTLTSTVGSTILGNTSGTGTATFSGVAAAGNTITIGATTYTFQTAGLGAVGNVLRGASASDSAGNLSAAINNVAAQCVNPAGGPCFNVSGANASVGSAAAAGVVTVGNLTNGAVAWSKTSGVITLSPAPIPAPTGSCTSSTAGNLGVNATPATVATYLATAINSCNTTFPAVGITASAAGNVVTVTNTTVGSPASSLTLGGNASNFVWSIVTAGTAGTNACTSSTTGNFATGSSTATVASNIAAAINACTTSYPGVGFTASYGSGNTFTVSSVAAGPYLAVGASNNAGLFSWGTLTVGSSGTNTCPSSTAGTFATSNSTTTLATNLAAAIAACPAAAGVTASSAAAVVTVTARTAGSSGDSIALGNTLSNFTWSGADLSGGTDGVTSANTFAYWSGAAAASQAQVAANIASAINLNPTLQVVATGVSARSNGATITVTANAPGPAGNAYATTTTNFAGFAWGGATLSGGVAGAVVQPNMYPAKYSFSTTTASCSDFVIYPMGTAGATGAATIVAFNNLYAGAGACIALGASPPPYWAYNTGGMATTSPVPSLDGTQVMFVQVSGTTASLVLLKWSANSGTPTLPVTPAAATPATYQGCTAPCAVTLAFSGNPNDTFSAPYYDYSGDTAYVGDDSGKLHKFTGLFKGTPAEAGSPWPVTLGASKLSLPVYDSVTGNVIVGDFAGGALGALHSVTASTGAVHGTANTGGDAIADAPLVDSSAGKLYAFVTTIGTHNTVYELSTNFTTNAGAGVQQVGTGGAGYYLYHGIFDNVYYSSATSTGNLYVVGNTGLAASAILYRIPINSSVMGAPVAVINNLTSGAARPWPSTLNEFCNNGLSACATNGTQTTAGTDYIFFSVYRGNVGGCTNTAGHGCVLSYNVSNPAAVSVSGSGLTVTTPGGNGCWPTGGIVIDNSVPAGTLAGASQTYFIGLGSNLAGGSTGSTSANCAGGAAATMSATQASQANP